MFEVVRWISLVAMWASVAANWYCIFANRKLGRKYRKSIAQCELLRKEYEVELLRLRNLPNGKEQSL